MCVQKHKGLEEDIRASKKLNTTSLHIGVVFTITLLGCGNATSPLCIPLRDHTSQLNDIRLSWFLYRNIKYTSFLEIVPYTLWYALGWIWVLWDQSIRVLRERESMRLRVFLYLYSLSRKKLFCGDPTMVTRIRERETKRSTRDKY